jgi:hypothetical protein
MEVKCGWKKTYSCRKALVDEATSILYESGYDEEKKKTVQGILLSTGQFDSKDWEGGDPMQSKEYIQRPYAGYTKYKYCACQINGKIASRSEGKGAAIIFEESISLEQAMVLVKMTVSMVIDAEAMEFNYDMWVTFNNVSAFERNLLCLLIMSKPTLIRHAYFALKKRDFHLPRGLRDRALQILTSDGQKIEVTLSLSMYSEF